MKVLYTFQSPDYYLASAWSGKYSPYHYEALKVLHHGYTQNEGWSKPSQYLFEHLPQGQKIHNKVNLFTLS